MIKIKTLSVTLTLITILFSLFILDCKSNTYKKYGKNIRYSHFSKLSEQSNCNKKIKLPRDLRRYLNDPGNAPRIKDHKCFEKEFWEEAVKIGYSVDKLKNSTIKESIMAAVEAVSQRIKYYDVDLDKDFIAKHGSHLPSDEYWKLGLGDCDKYKDLTIAAFNIIKKYNRKLDNVYLSNEDLGGRIQPHAWVSIIIPNDEYLLLSHIDPTEFDNLGHLEADEYHLIIDHDIFIACFYQGLSCHEYSYKILKEAYLKIESSDDKFSKWQLLDQIRIAVAFLGSKITAEEIEWVIKEYDLSGYDNKLDELLYRAYETYTNWIWGNKIKSEKYKQRLLKEYPNSFYSKLLKNRI